MKGRRVEVPSGLPEPGDYYLHPTAGWLGMTPDGQLTGLRGHQVVEHEDGTITVSPSIMVNQGRPDEWHGYLERGVWRKC